MKKIISLLIVASLFVVLASGTASAAFWHKSHVKVITKEQLQVKMASREGVQVVNVLSPDFYNLGSIKGSKKIPLSELSKRAGELDKNKEVVTYCASYKCRASKEAAQKLAKMGFNVSAYEGGIKEWKDSYLPTEA